MTSDLKKFPLVKLAERYRKIRTDTRILSLRASIEVVRGRIEQLAERIDFGDAPDRLNRLDKLWEEYLEAAELGHRSEEILLRAQLTVEFKKARDDYAAWTQMLIAMDLDRKLVDSEVKIIKEIKGILTAEDAHELVAKMLSIILRVFPEDKRKLRQVQYEFIRMIGDQPINVPVPAVEDEDEDDAPLEGTLAEENEPLHAERD